MILGQTILVILVSVLAIGSLLTLLVASIISVRRQPSWHAVCRVVGVGIHGGSLLAVLILLTAGPERGIAWNVDDRKIVGLAMIGIVGTALFASGYLGQVLTSGINKGGEPR